MLLQPDLGMRIAAACLLALLQVSEDPRAHTRERERLLREAESRPKPVLGPIETVNLLSSLREPARYWEFLIAPDTAYLERWTAAMHARELLPLEWLPRLLAARRELEAESRMHGFGLLADPRSAVPGLPPDSYAHVPRLRSILGATWTLPERRVDFPVTWEEVCRAPWPWQVQNVLEEVYLRIRPSGSESGDDVEWSRRWLEECLKLPWGSDEEARLFVEASQGSTHMKSVPILARWRAIALDPRFAEGARAVAQDLVVSTRLWSDPRSQDLGAVIAVDILRESPSTKSRGELAWTLSRWERRASTPKESSGPSWIRGGGPPATAFLAMARLACDERTGSAWERYYLYASSCCECLVDPPFAPDRRLDPASPAVVVGLQRLADWLRVHEGELDAAARAEAPRLDAARRTLLDSLSDPK